MFHFGNFNTAFAFFETDFNFLSISDTYLVLMSDSWHPPMIEPQPFSDVNPAITRDRDQKLQKLNPRNISLEYAYHFFAVMATLSISMMAWELMPISLQAERWNSCFDESFRWILTYHPTDSTLVSKLWATRNCNGGSLSIPRH